MISEITQADGHLTAASRLTQKGKDLIQGRLYSKIIARQILSMLSDDARQVIESQSYEYSWTDLAGLDEEIDGMTISAHVLCCLCPHHKVDMYADIGIIKMISIA